MISKKNLLGLLQKLLRDSDQEDLLPSLDRNCFQASCDLIDNILPGIEFDPNWQQMVRVPTLYRTCSKNFTSFPKSFIHEKVSSIRSKGYGVK